MNLNTPPTTDPDDKIALIHQWRDSADRQRDLIRDYEAEESVRNERAQAYLNWKAWCEQAEATQTERRLIVLVAICAVLGAFIWAAMFARLVF